MSDPADHGCTDCCKALPAMAGLPFILRQTWPPIEKLDGAVDFLTLRLGDGHQAEDRRCVGARGDRRWQFSVDKVLLLNPPRRT